MTAKKRKSTSANPRAETPDASQANPSDHLIRPLQIGLSLLLLLQVAGALLPGPLLWGFNHLVYLTGPLGVLWPLAGLALIWTRLGDRLGKLLVERLAPALFDRPLVAYLMVPITGALIFWLLRCKIHFLGDGWLIGEMVNIGVKFHGYDFIDYYLHYVINQLFGLTDEWDTFRMFGVLSVIAGAGYLAAAAWISRRTSEENSERILLYGMLVFATPVQMFMGYVECYSFLAIFMMLYVTSLSAHYERGMRLTVPALMLGIGLMFHLDALFIAPVFLAVLFWPAPSASRSFPARLLQAGLPILIPLGIALGIYLLGGYNRAFYENDFVAGRRLQRVFTWWTGAHGFLSWNHWKDLLNMHLMLTGVPVVMVTVALHRLRKVGGMGRIVWILAIGGLWLVGLTSVLHMKLGIVRDWDLFAAQSVIFVSLAFVVISRLTGGRPNRRLVGMVVGTAFVLSLPWFLLNADESSSLARFRGVITDLPRFGQAYAHEEIGKYCRKQGRIDEALGEYVACTEIFPENARFHAVLGALQYNNGRKDQALNTFHAVLKADSTYVLGMEMIARIHGEREEYNEALPYCRRLAGNPEETANAAMLHGAVEVELGNLEEGLKGYERAYRKASNNPVVLERIGILCMLLERFQPAERAFRELVRRQPGNFPGIMGLIMSVWQPISMDQASWSDPRVQARLTEVTGLIDQLIASGQANDDLLIWQRDIRAILENRDR
jgi:tetratricopeptide (TPR) repeat protein